ncbi:MAG: c-type cytochrome, partial [Verrucomicrobiota bacterium]|nr:c-type cytochrome [Verrucomicrobiota bacterium]
AAESKRDRWIEYAFSQAVHHSKRHWLPALRAGKLDFAGVRRGLAAVLGSSGSKGVLEEIRTLVRGGNVEGEARDVLVLTLVAVGEEEDLRTVLNADRPGAGLLRMLKDRERPKFDVMPPLGRALLHPEVEGRIAAVELAAHWKVKELYLPVLKLAGDVKGDAGLRDAALRALGSLGSRETIGILKAAVGAGADLQPAALAAILELDPEEAARGAAVILRKLDDPQKIASILSDFAGREGAPVLLAKELATKRLDPGQAERLRQSWVATGFVDEELGAALDRMAGLDAGPAYDEERVRKLVAAARRGDRERGAEVFRSSQAGCAACHQVGGAGGVIGPDLSAVGSGLLPERIVTEVLWPRQQVKEGYVLSRIITRDGGVQQGYVQASRDEGILLLRDFATNSLHEIPR